MGTQGYQIIATGLDRYLRLATACAASLRYWDRTRPIQLVTDLPVELLLDPRDQRLFDVVSAFPEESIFVGTLSKLCAYDLAVFAETMFVDADCLLLKSDMDMHWARLSTGHDACVVGEVRTAGSWYGMAIEDMCALAGVDQLVQTNSGAIYFKRNAGRALFDYAKHLVLELGNFSGHLHHGIAPSDEPYLALACGALGLKPYPLRDEANNSWMTSTFNTRGIELDAFSGHTALVKPNRTVSPSLCHFVGLYPADLYHRIAHDLLVWARGEQAEATDDARRGCDPSFSDPGDSAG